MKNGKMGLAIVGLGMVARTHVNALRDLSDKIEIIGVYARDPAKRQAFAEAHDLPVATSVDDLARNDEVDAALVLTPPNARMEITEAFAGAGKHILMEKPVERTTAAATALVEMCENAGVVLGIVLQHRFRDGACKLREMMAAGDLGKLVIAQVAIPWWRPQAYYDEPGRGTLARDGGGVLISQAIHTLDLMLSITGVAREVQGVAGTTRLHRMETEDFAAAGIRFANGAIGSFSATTALFPGETETLRFGFEKASVRLEGNLLFVDWYDGRSESFGEETGTGGGADPMAFPHDWHREVIADFHRCATEGGTPAISGREALNVHRLIEAVLASSAEGRAVTIGGNDS